jgi:hypothetical protein
MLDSHPSVSMQSEVVKLVVHWNRVETEADFVFLNSGKACNVKMGFPDFGLWAYAYPRKKPETMFTSFRSYVDGKPVKTVLVLGKGHGEQWQTKTVAFPANGKRIVREAYTTDLGGAAVDKRPWAFVCYLLHTGASWKGNIGTATILVTFAPDSEVAAPLDVLIADAATSTPKSIADHLAKPGGVLVMGPTKPTVDGRTLKFETQNWRPTERDDVYVGFAYPKRAMRRYEAQAKRWEQPPTVKRRP